ncbi:Ppx/GppA phosphatase family protein [Cellulomonas persica]|uniref:Ppx/GppA phosphatase N-terminal domain-containing protein n=1 Tax=Cellulomonas persica TaxID=76861 RepID=A0A510UWE0_9CELL|nr:Ppx/GppA family phosphatase [Cellulomonas persica]GEK19014.1 hypothetical protein CPE01_27470 [Cellulomonas persica]
MPVVVPRWEWRTFGQHLGAAEAVLAAREPDQVHDSDELYLLAPGRSSSGRGTVVKVRDELMDVKRLHDVSPDGLQRWAPERKSPFPLTHDDALAVLEALGVEGAGLPVRDAHSLPGLLDALAATAPDVLVVEVHKERRRYTLDGCPAELTHVRTSHGSTRTIAVEHADPDLVRATVRALGLGHRANTSYPRGLEALLGPRPGRFAVIDVGTNSVKLHVGERHADGTWTTVLDRADITRLGDGLRETGRLRPEPVARTVDAITRMADEARTLGAVEIAAVGTAGMRIAPNAADVVDAVAQRAGVVLQVISGEEEARLAYRAATAELPLAGRQVVFDTGGGSSQFTFGTAGRVDERFSVEVGAVRFTERFGLDSVVGRDVLDDALAAIAADLGRLDGRPVPDSVVAMGGAVTNLAAVRHGLSSYDPDVVQGTVLDRAEIDRQIELYRTSGPEERRAIVGLQPARAEVILAGACIVRSVLDRLGADALTVSDRGLRYGVRAEAFG